MIKSSFSAEKRKNKTLKISTQLVIVGGGMAGVCGAITAARQGLKVVLVQDRPVLGGNASSEVRLWILGATSHMGNNNRWAREGGVIDEILIENLYRNKEGNPLIFDTILLEKVKEEPNITLLLNTAMYQVEKSGDRKIKGIKAFCSQNSTEYHIESPYFCDASGDGILAFQAGASFRMGAEPMEEFGEKFAPDVEDYGELLGHTMYFYSKRAERPVKYVPPSFALEDITEIPKYKILSQTDIGCRLWWLEFGGRTDTVHETENIKWELWKVIYGIWDYIKNSGEFEDVDNLTLEWVATIPGKRESRRFEGLYMIKQQDVVEQRYFEDAVTRGGWSLDLHPSDGVYTSKPGCNQWHSKGVYGIPYRCYVSRDIENLWFAGRIISASHVAFGSTRVMATCAHGGQAVGMAATVAAENNLLPAQLLDGVQMHELQQRLSIVGQGVPHIGIEPVRNLVNKAKVNVSSTFELQELPFDGDWLLLDQGAGQLLPLQAGQSLSLKVQVRAKIATDLKVEFKTSSRLGNFTPDVLKETLELPIEKGEQFVEITLSKTLVEDQYAFILFRSNEALEIRTSELRLTGVLSVFNKANKAVSNLGKQEPDADIGVDAFEFWTPARRPEGKNIAMSFETPLQLFNKDQIGNGFLRPIVRTNAWAADLNDVTPTIDFEWDEPQEIREIKLFFDNDYDHPLESSLQGHPEDIIPFCVNNYRIEIRQEELALAGIAEEPKGNKIFANKKENKFVAITSNENSILCKQTNNHQTINTYKLSQPITTKRISIELEHPKGLVPASLFEVLIH